MTYEALALLLMMIGFALVVAEVFLPSGGLLTILCVVAFSSSVWCAHKAWFDEQPAYFWTFLGAQLVLIPSSVVIAFRFLERSHFGRKVLLSAPSQEEVVPHRGETSRLAGLVGLTGQALTQMTPGGMVLVQGERLHAESDGSLIAAGTEIEVFGVKGTRVLVRERSAPRDAEAAAPSSLAAGPGTAAGAAPSPLDFDFPHG